MAEQLGEALLVLRTEDSGLDRGIGQAEGKARALGAQFDRTAGSTKRFSAELTSAGRAAVASGAQFQRAGQQVTNSAGAQRAGVQQLGMQIGDMATMYSLGARPMQIFSSQIGQVTQAIQLAAGGTSRFAAFLGGPWGIALTAATIVLVPLIGKLFETEDAMEKVKFASSAMADAQGILGGVIDLTTGKINTQSAALLALARAQLVAGQIQARREQAEARQEMVGIRKGSIQMTPNPMGFGKLTRVGDASADIVSAFQDGSLSLKEAESGLRSMMRSGMISEGSYLRAAAAITKYGVAGENIKVYEQAGKGLDGDSGALKPFLNPKTGRTPRTPKGPKPPKDRSAELADRADGEVARLEQEELRARLDLATDVGDRAAIQRDLLNQERAERVRQIEANKDLTEAQKKAQLAVIDRLYGKEGRNADGTITVEAGGSLLGQKLWRDVSAQQAQLANDALARQADVLQSQADIATNLDKRDDLERRALEINQQIQRNLLDQDIANGRVADADAARAQLAERQAAERARQLLSQRSPLEAYRDALRASAENVDDAIEAIQVKGLEDLNDGLADAFMGAKSLGEVFHDIAGQIVRDLLRIAIQRALIEPLANALLPAGGGGVGGGLFGFIGKALGFAGLLSGSGPTNLLGGTPYGGGKAVGGAINAGTAYLVGERGPEMIVPGNAGTVIPNHALGAPAVVELRIARGEMFDAEVERISGDVSVRTLQEGAPIIVEGAVSETARRLARPRM